MVKTKQASWSLRMRHQEASMHKNWGIKQRKRKKKAALQAMKASLHFKLVIEYCLTVLREWGKGNTLLTSTSVCGNIHITTSTLQYTYFGLHPSIHTQQSSQGIFTNLLKLGKDRFFKLYYRIPIGDHWHWIYLRELILEAWRVRAERYWIMEDGRCKLYKKNK